MKRSTPYYSAGLVAFLTFLVYLPALQNDLVELDDAVYILDNPYIRSFNSDLFQWAFLRFHAANWHPLTWISHAVDYAVWGLNPLGHHLTSIVFHAINTGLVVLLALKLLEAAAGTSGTSRLTPDTSRFSLIAATTTGLLFGLHPLHVESVAWVAERKDLLCAFFFLLSILMYMRYVRGQRTEGRAQRTDERQQIDSHKDTESHRRVFADKHYLLALGLFVLALMSKPMAVTLPVVLLILDWYPLGRLGSVKALRRACKEKVPFIALSLASAVLTILAQKAGEALVSTQIIPWSGRVLVAARSLLTYLGKMALPYDLAPYYPYPGLHEILVYRAEYLIPVILLIVVTATFIKVMKKQKIWFAAWCYYVVTLLPVLGIIQVGGQAMADRYTYLPSLGPFLGVGLGGALICSRTYAGAGYFRLLRVLSFVAVVGAFLLLSALTIRQIGIWKDSMVVLNAVLAKESRRNATIYVHRGVAYEKRGELGEAIGDYTTAISLFPSYYDAFFSRATAYERMGMFDRALEDYTTAISLKPSSFEAYTNRGLVNKKLGMRIEAIADFNRAVMISPSAGKAYLNLGIIDAEEGRFAQAIEQFGRAIAADPMDSETYGNRGIAYAVIGQQGPALKDFNRAIALRPDFAEIYYNRGKLYAVSGQQERALADFQQACRLGDEISCRVLRE